MSRSNAALSKAIEVELHRRCVRFTREMGYRPSFLIELAREQGAVAAIRRLIRKPCVSSTFVRLQAAGRLDLAVESLVVDERWARLFTDRDRAIASVRLALGAQDAA